MGVVETIGQRLGHFFKQEGYTLSKAAETTQVHVATLHDIVEGGVTPRFTTLLAIWRRFPTLTFGYLLNSTQAEAFHSPQDEAETLYLAYREVAQTYTQLTARRQADLLPYLYLLSEAYFALIEGHIAYLEELRAT